MGGGEAAVDDYGFVGFPPTEGFDEVEAAPVWVVGIDGGAEGAAKGDTP